jgi:hypothetical protein
VPFDLTRAVCVFLGVLFAFGCGEKGMVRPTYQPIYDATLRLDAVMPSGQNASLAATAVFADSAHSSGGGPATTSAGQVQLESGGTLWILDRAPGTRLSYLLDNLVPRQGAAYTFSATGTTDTIAAFSAAVTLPLFAQVTEPIPETVVHPSRGLRVAWTKTLMNDSMEVKILSLVNPADSVISRLRDDAGFTTFSSQDITRLPTGEAVVLVTRIHRASFSANGLRSGTLVATATASIPVTIEEPAPYRGRDGGARGGEAHDVAPRGRDVVRPAHNPQHPAG